MLEYAKTQIKMNQERVKLIVQNMELLVRALKDELELQSPDLELPKYDDYDEIFDE